MKSGFRYFCFIFISPKTAWMFIQRKLHLDSSTTAEMLEGFLAEGHNKK
jgi:hypothetical protein